MIGFFVHQGSELCFGYRPTLGTAVGVRLAYVAGGALYGLLKRRSGLGMMWLVTGIMLLVGTGFPWPFLPRPPRAWLVPAIGRAAETAQLLLS